MTGWNQGVVRRAAGLVPREAGIGAHPGAR